jgi:hypothetical protein
MEMRAERRALDKIYKRRDRYEIPDWQRQKVWDAKKKRKLVDTILRGWKLPKFYFQKTRDNPDEFEVVDGQQRLSAIWEFLDGDLTLDAEQSKQFGGSTYAELPEHLSDFFDDYEIEYDEITNASDEELKEFFQRLQEGLPLTSSEKLNSIHSNLRDFCVTASQHPFFTETTVISDKRYAHFDIVAKVATIEIEGIESGLRFQDVKDVFEANAAFSDKSAASKRIIHALEFLYKQFPESFPIFRNRTIVQSVITLVCHLHRVGFKMDENINLPSFVQEFFSELRQQVELGQNATDHDFLEFQRTVNANIKSGANIRHAILLRHLFKKHPALFTNVSQSAEIAESMAKDRKRLAREIQDLVKSINERYAASHGRDLFKPTNKTVSALRNLSKNVDNIDQYKHFIESLYFIFWEGAGNRIETPPQSFTDLNELRTMVQHDLDHGEARKASKKRRRVSATFERYSGYPSPDAIDPTSFALVQVNLLSALKTDLNALAKSIQ